MRKCPWEDPCATAATCVPRFAAHGSGRSHQLVPIRHRQGSSWLPEAALSSHSLLDRVQGADLELGARHGFTSRRLPAWIRRACGWSRSWPSALASPAWGWRQRAAPCCSSAAPSSQVLVSWTMVRCAESP